MDIWIGNTYQLFHDHISDIGLSSEDFSILIQSLYRVTASDPDAHKKEILDGYGVPQVIASLTRIINGYMIICEDRGVTCNVWIKKINASGGIQEVVWWCEFKWDLTWDLFYPSQIYWQAKRKETV